MPKPKARKVRGFLRLSVEKGESRFVFESEDHDSAKWDSP
jgi:hypothetical protein